ncbi:uncharacterized protein cubi_02445 [Cryptosporidium ubiquitum]|uniref:Inner centromere protein ARK-binding domain-containing protein n=1 Tax=Cryptosporidium ubiquitum TaxID=857276 RepID=A0A1J4MK44_9CRYT|nr:uncharacterized protein cubi_02445 [Cryptosporidium ubiquitum]OII73213.1 hypothetical protein cubi_02445 [Cryptosporidium ubiquitum]
MADLERSGKGVDCREIGGMEVATLEDLRKMIGLLERAKESSLKRLDRAFSLMEKNFEGLKARFNEGDLSFLDYRMCDVDLPEMEVDPTEEEINDVVNGFLRRVVEAGKIQLKQLKRELSEVKEVTESIVASKVSGEDEQILESPKPKKTKDESGFVASMKRLWENKTPKLSSIWRRNEESKNPVGTKLGITKLDNMNILDGLLAKSDAERDVDIKVEVNSIVESAPETKTEMTSRKEPSFKSISNEDVISPGPPNAIMSMGLSPLQSPPLLALTPSTPIPIVPTAVSHQTQREGVVGGEGGERGGGGGCGGGGRGSSISKVQGEVLSEEIIRTSVAIGSGEVENHAVVGKERVSKSTTNANEDSPLPPRPIRRQTSERIQEKGIEEITEGEQTPVLKGGLEGTPLDKNRVEMGENGFVRPERISHVKKSGLRSILHHSANRVPPGQSIASGTGENNNGSGGSSNTIRQSRGSTAFGHLVKTPINKGFCSSETEGKDKLRIGESPCRRYHKRLKLLPPVNPDECYVLTDSEDEQQGCGTEGGGSGGLKTTKIQKKIPLWARSMNWIPKMKEQRNVDPFSIFGDSCMFMDLEDVFQRPWYISTVARDNRIKSWQNDRVTSLNWSEDSLTSDELRQYKVRMNLYIDKSNEVYVTEPCFTPSPNPLANGAWNHINKQRINSGNTTVIRKALNLSIHRFNNSISSKLASLNNSSLQVHAPLASSSSASSKLSETTSLNNLQDDENSNIENNNIANFLSKPKNSSKDAPDTLHPPIISNSSFLQ